MQKIGPKWWKHVDRAINTAFLIYLAYALVAEWRSFIPPRGVSKLSAFISTLGQSIGWLILLLVAFGATIAALVFVFLRNDKSTDPIWLRGLRVIGFIASAMAILVFLSYLKN